MEEIIIITLYFLGEVILNALIYLPGDIFLSIHELNKDDKLNILPWAILSLFLGIITGFISIALLSSAILPFSWLRVINLIASPLLSGTIALQMSKLRNNKNKQSNNKLHYLVGFLFTFGFVCVRIALTTKI